MKKLLLSFLLLLATMPLWAHDFEAGGIYYNYLDKSAKTVEVTYRGSSYVSYSNEYTGTVSIPSSVTYGGTTYTVTSIDAYAFAECTGLISVAISNSVTSIESCAFSDCTALTSVIIGNSVTSIGSYVFDDCTDLSKVTIGNSVTEIGKYAFSDCTALTSVAIPNSVTSIGNGAFSGCTGLTSITIPNSVTLIGEVAFVGCTGLTTVNYNAENCTSMGSSMSPAFEICSNFKTLNIGNEVKTIPNYAFLKCSGLTSVIIPNSVTEIGNSAFSGCTGLTSATIPNSVTEIGNSAFSGCTGLTSVTIGNSVASIGSYAFACINLTEVCISDLSAWCKIDFGSLTANPLYNGKKLKLNGVEIKELVIPDDITQIKDYAFIECSGVTSVIIGNSVVSIGSSAFYSCDGLSSVIIGKSVETIVEDAFNSSRYLEKIISLNSTPPTCTSSKSFHSNNYSKATLYVPKDSYAKYFIDDIWGQFTNIKKIEILASSIALNNSMIKLDKGNAAILTATIAPSNATIKNIVWTSSNPLIATVDQSGKVTAFLEGTATITATAVDGSDISASCNVVVNNSVETKIALSQTEANLPVNEVMTLSYTVTPSNTPVDWSTNNPDVANIRKNANGSVTVGGMADGEAIITAKATDGSGASASCKVIVGVGGVEGVEVDNNSKEVARYDIHGRLLSEPTKGINIIKMSDGSTRKEFVK